MNETDIKKLIQLEATKLGCRLFINNTGALQDKTGRWVHFGLCEGSSDLIGLTRDGRFLAVEVKKPGARTKPERLIKQRAFLDMINSFGGIGIMVSSVEEFLKEMAARL